MFKNISKIEYGVWSDTKKWVLYKNTIDIDKLCDIETYTDISKTLYKSIKKDVIYLNMTDIWALNSYCKRKKTAALIVSDNMIISDGYNGTPIGFDNTCEENNITFPHVLHAEANAITKIAKSSNSCNNAKIYCTLSPCIECSKLIHQAGIKEVIFSEFYRDISGLDFLIKANIIVKFIDKLIIKKFMLNYIDI